MNVSIQNTNSCNVEYAVIIWDPFNKRNIIQLEKCKKRNAYVLFMTPAVEPLYDEKWPTICCGEKAHMPPQVFSLR